MTSSKTHDLNMTGVGSLLRQRFFELALETPAIRSVHGWTEERIDSLVTGFLNGLKVSQARSPYDYCTWLGQKGDLAVFVGVEADGAWEVSAAGATQAAVDEYIDKARGLFPTADTDDDSVKVRFWALGPLGPESYVRRLEVSQWEGSHVNYPGGNDDSTQQQLARLVRMQAPPDSGRLMLFHGPPGTGKTHFIRSLVAAWQSWCDVDYVVDADEFFGHASYMVGAMVMNEDPQGDRWRVVVLEDSGEFLVADRDDRPTQGLSRLLNLSDGLVGQGLRLMMLMTTNEPVEELHGAVTRPGRCLANVRFGEFDPKEATAWLEAHGVEEKVKEPQTLAQLYARLGPARASKAKARVEALRR